MIERSPSKTSRNVSAKGSRKAAPRSPAKDANKAAEIETLRRELEAARAEIVDLKRRQAEAATRIDWLIDSLQNLS